MSLVIDLGITYTDGSLRSIDRLIIRRLTGLRRPLRAEDEVHEYEAYLSAEDVYVRLEHRYGDGAWVLVRKALEELETQHGKNVETVTGL